MFAPVPACKKDFFLVQHIRKPNGRHFHLTYRTAELSSDIPLCLLVVYGQKKQRENKGYD